MTYKNPAWFTPEDIRANQEHIKSIVPKQTTFGTLTWAVRDRDANPTPPPNTWQRFLLRFFL